MTLGYLLLTSTPGAGETTPMVYPVPGLPGYEHMPRGWDSETVVAPGQSIDDAVRAAPSMPFGRRHLIRLLPGTYTDRVAARPRVDILADQPGTVTVEADGVADPGRWAPLTTAGGPIAIGGIRWRCISGAGSGIYACHHRAHDLTVFEKCVFRSESEARPTTFGTDTEANAGTYFIDCVFEPTSGAATNCHGPGGNSVTAFLRCTATGAVGYDALDQTAPDDLWVVESSVPSVIARGSALRVHTSGWPTIPDWT